MDGAADAGSLAESRTSDSLPYWIRLLDSHSLSGAGVNNPSKLQVVPHGQKSCPHAKDRGDDATPQDEVNAWYNSPILDKPVVGYYNRDTQSNASKHSDQPEPTFQDKTSQWFRGLDTSARSVEHPNDQVQNHHIGEQGLYSDLYSPWLENWPSSTKQDNRFITNNQGVTNSGFTSKEPSQPPSNFSYHHNSKAGYPSGIAYEENLSRDDQTAEVLKPEEYLSGLQRESFTVQYGGGNSPCSRCPRLVAVVLLLMALAIVGLVVALTVSILGQKELPDSKEPKGYPVVRAAMTLKILNKNFTTEMSDPESKAFYSVASPYSAELDRLFLTSPLAGVYRGNKIISLKSGSIVTEIDLLFLDNGIVKEKSTVRDVITSADRASQWAQSDAREVGQFVVCSDCVTVEMDFTRIRQLPPVPVLQNQMISMGTTQPGDDSGGNMSTKVTTPNVLLSNTTPFLEDGHFVISCDVTNVGSLWSVLTIEFMGDNSDGQFVALVTLRQNLPSLTEVSSHVKSRIFAFPSATSNSLGVVVNVTSVKCTDRGDYLCRVTLKDGKEFSHHARVGILELPSVPTISEKPSSLVWDATPVYTCSAQLGYPPGTLQFAFLVKGSNRLQELPAQMSAGKSCEDAAEIRVSALDPGLPEAAYELVCRVLSQHLPLLNSSLYTVNLQISVSSKLEIQTKSTSVGDGMAAIRCRLFHPGSWLRMTLLKMTHDGGSDAVVTLHKNETLQWSDPYLRHRTLSHVTVGKKMAEFSIFIFSLKCVDEGRYSCAVHGVSSISQPQANLTVTAKPTQPEVRLPDDIAEGDNSPFRVECRAKVGHPPGKLVLSVKSHPETQFQEMAFNEVKTTPLSCSTEVRGIYYPGIGALSNGSSISCHVAPHQVLRDVVEPVASVKLFKMLNDELCAGLGNTNTSNPSYCRHVIHCKDDVIAGVSKCSAGQCYDKSSKRCTAASEDSLSSASPDSVCYPDKNLAFFPHPHQCTAFIQCHRGQEVSQYCHTGQLYVTRRLCSDDVTKSHCYKTLDVSSRTVTNSSVLE